MNVRCETHGLLPWLGHGFCDKDDGGCSKLYKHILQADLTCVCGKRLLPYGRKAVVERMFAALREAVTFFTARPMCARCYQSTTHEMAQTSEGDARLDNLGLDD